MVSKLDKTLETYQEIPKKLLLDSNEDNIVKY